jgi:hypothetical protein
MATAAAAAREGGPAPCNSPEPIRKIRCAVRRNCRDQTQRKGEGREGVPAGAGGAAREAAARPTGAPLPSRRLGGPGPVYRLCRFLRQIWDAKYRLQREDGTLIDRLSENLEELITLATGFNNARSDGRPITISRSGSRKPAAGPRAIPSARRPWRHRTWDADHVQCAPHRDGQRRSAGSARARRGQGQADRRLRLHQPCPQIVRATGPAHIGGRRYRQSELMAVIGDQAAERLVFD